MPELFPQLLLLAGGIGALYFGAEWLIHGAANLASRVGVSPIVIGLTVVSIGTSAPELAVCLIAVARDQPDLAIGNVMGSNLANLGLVLGLTAVMSPLRVAARVVRREVPIMIGMTMVLILPLLDLELSRGDGVVLVALLGAYLMFVLRSARDEPAEIQDEFEEFVEGKDGSASNMPFWRAGGLIVVGIAGLVIGGRAIIESATYLAEAAGIPDLYVGLTIVAIGTSLPELATSLVAAARQEADIAVGNAIGSNIFNIGAVLGGTALFHPVAVTPHVLRYEFPAVLLISILVLPLARTSYTIKRTEGGLLFLSYVGLGLWIFW